MYNRFVIGNGIAKVCQPSDNNENKGRPTYEYYIITGIDKNSDIIVEYYCIQFTWGKPYASDKFAFDKIKKYKENYEFILI